MSISLSLAAATLDLTPRRAVPMGGYEGPERLSRRTHGTLEANIVALGEGAEAVVLVSIDALFAGREVTTQVVRACAERFGVGADRVLVLASHTHFAPMLDAAKPRLGDADPAELARWSELIEAKIRTLEFRRCAGARIGLAMSDRAVNRRLRWRAPTLVRVLGKKRGDVYMCDAPEGPRDPRIRTCVWTAPDGSALAAFWSFACHPVCFPDRETASADYVGVVRQALRRKLGATTPVVFAPGCMGDVRPPSAAPWKTWGRAPTLATFGPTPVAYDRPGWDAWADGLAEEVVAADEGGVTAAVTSIPTATPMVRVPTSVLFDGSCPTPDVTLKAVDAPGIGRIVALSCEPVADVAGLVAAPGDLVLGYEGDVFGYLPTERMIAEGGYEPADSHRPFDMKGAFQPGLDEIVRALGTRSSA